MTHICIDPAVVTVILSTKNGRVYGEATYDVNRSGGTDFYLSGQFIDHVLAKGTFYKMEVCPSAEPVPHTHYITPSEDLMNFMEDDMKHGIRNGIYEDGPRSFRINLNGVPKCVFTHIVFREMTNAEIVASGLLKQEIF